MNMRTIFLTLTLCLFSHSGIVFGAEVAKIGVVDFQRIIDKSNAGKRSSVEIKSQGKKMEQILKEKGAEIEELKKTLDQKALVMSEDVREAKEKDLRIKINDLKSLQRRYQDVLSELNVNLSKQIMKDVFEIVERIGKREGYLLIIDRRIGGVIYAPNAIDITDKIIQEYNALDAKRSKKEDASAGLKKKQ
ncbi:MAG: OmpH family outer membrane protein [Deltaproteobacteria bacterium]|nr:OmpH family outer membrane protein [Deltaproteobacteria bacterium]MBW2074560.1 OmpH family outer membrane protein [Deltaproteobacteria bacterium]